MGDPMLEVPLDTYSEPVEAVEKQMRAVQESIEQLQTLTAAETGWLMRRTKATLELIHKKRFAAPTETYLQIDARAEENAPVLSRVMAGLPGRNVRWPRSRRSIADLVEKKYYVRIHYRRGLIQWHSLRVVLQEKAENDDWVDVSHAGEKVEKILLADDQHFVAEEHSEESSSEESSSGVFDFSDLQLPLPADGAGRMFRLRFASRIVDKMLTHFACFAEDIEEPRNVFELPEWVQQYALQESPSQYSAEFECKKPAAFFGDQLQVDKSVKVNPTGAGHVRLPGETGMGQKALLVHARLEPGVTPGFDVVVQGWVAEIGVAAGPVFGKDAVHEATVLYEATVQENEASGKEVTFAFQARSNGSCFTLPAGNAAQYRGRRFCIVYQLMFHPRDGADPIPLDERQSIEFTTTTTKEKGVAVPRRGRMHKPPSRMHNRQRPDPSHR